ncbi:hypothetical protein C7S18_08285 [Ahniella affigens]|uniref:histidine kinase n=2 Tax=Ahniella affigens TaxID=2021234 RepID=A0A2P1PQT0_9GAMM|nr:hypothetical protein C7S18_08285 [Ahniella affigens]
MGIFGFVVSLTREPETVVVVVARKQARALPPFEYVTDRDRLLGLVFEPLCPPPQGQRPLQIPVPAVAECRSREDHVQIKLRSDANWHGQRLTAETVKALLDDHEVRMAQAVTGTPKLWSKISILSRDELQLQVPSNSKSAHALSFALSEIHLAAEQDGCRIGTGDWSETRCTQEDFSFKKRLLPPALRDSPYVRDVALLEQNQWLRRRRVLVVGLDSEKSELEGQSVLIQPLALALSAEAGQRVHLIRGLEDPEIQALRVKLSAAADWSLLSRRGDRSTWLVARPSLPKQRRLELLSAAGKVLSQPSYFDENSGSPSRSLLPQVYPPMVFSGASNDGSSCPADDAVSSDDFDRMNAVPVLLTHTRWRGLAARLAERSDANLEVVVLDAEKESSRRRAWGYELSIQSPVAQDDSHPSRVFADNLASWFPTDHPLFELAQEVAEDEAQNPAAAVDRLKHLMRCLDSYMVPISNPPTWALVHQDLRGWNAAADWLNPEDVGLRSYEYRNLGWWGIGLMGLGVLLFGLLLRHNAYRARSAANIASFHHDLSSPLASIRAEAEYLRESLSAQASPAPESLQDVADFIDQQTSHVVDLVDNLRTTSSPEGWLFEQDATCELAPVLRAEVEAMQRRAKREGLVLNIQAPQMEVRVALGSSSLRRVLRNLLDNAYKYRGQGIETVSIRIQTALKAKELVIDIEDDGQGFDDFPTSQHFVPRQRGGRAREHQLPGQGLGLSSAQRLLHAAGGRVEVNHCSKPTRVRLRLPVADRSET